MANKKRMVFGVLACLLALTLLFSATAMASDEIIITINGEKVKCDVPPVVENGRILVPLRAVFEGLGMTVNFDAATETITGTDKDTKIIIQLDNTTAYVNGAPVKMAVAAKSINYRTMVPIRFVAENSGAVVSWDSGSRGVLISTVKSGPGSSGGDVGNPQTDVTDSGTLLSTTTDDDENGYADYILEEYGLFMYNNYAVIFDSVAIVGTSDTIAILMYMTPSCLGDFEKIRNLDADALLAEYDQISVEAEQEYQKDVSLFVIYYDLYNHYPSEYADNNIGDNTITDLENGSWLITYPLLEIDQYINDDEYYYFTWGN